MFSFLNSNEIKYTINGRCLENNSIFCGQTYCQTLGNFDNRSDGDKNFSLGWRHLCTESDEEAFEFFKKAAKDNHPYALHNLSVCYYHGIGIEAFPEQAMRFSSLAKDCLNEMENPNEVLSQKINNVFYSLIEITAEIKSEYSPLLKKS